MEFQTANSIGRIHSATVLVLLTMSLVLSSQRSDALELITDPCFQRGLNVRDPDRAQGGRSEGVINYDNNTNAPCWDLVQWNSHGTVCGAIPTLANGATKWANAYKAVYLGPVDSIYSDVRLTVNSINEYGGTYRNAGQDWPCLYVSQKICSPNGGFFKAEKGLWISDLTELRLKMKVLLAEEKNIQTNGYNSKRHRTHFRLNFPIMNLSPSKATGRGDYFHFGIKMYDEKEAFPGANGPNFRLDNAGSKKAIYNVGLAPFCTNGLVPGEWLEIEGDILGMIKDGLQACWASGAYLTNDVNLSSNTVDRYAFYKVNSVNIGWEATGLSCDSIQVKDLSLEAYGRHHPLP